MLLGLLVGVVWIGLFVFFAWGYHSKSMERSKLEYARSEKALLTHQMDMLFEKVDSLKSRIEFLTEQDRALRILADLPAIHEDTRQVGVGGPAYATGQYAYDGSQETGSPSSARVDIDRLLREADLLKSSLRDIEVTVTEQKRALDHTPTILPTAGYFSSFFGQRRDPFTGRYQQHFGVDIANMPGTPIHATADGVIAHFSNDRDYGRLLEINHGNGYVTRYGHLQKVLVEVGQKVERGQKIALMGSSGRSTSSHLHYEVALNGKCQNPLSYFYADVVVD
jgi:murein DD-endopeptidase MepM/ murein hydrolase activator NlpD